MGISKKLYPLAVICALAAAGCGSNADDIAKAMNASSNSGKLIARQAAQHLQSMRQKATQIHNSRMNQLIFSGTGCNGLTPDGDNCTITCPDNYTSNGSCSFSGQSYTCGGETFTFSDGTFTYSLVINSTTQVFSFTLNMSATVKGGDLDGKLDCKFVFNSQSMNSDALNCSDFACTYDGDSIDCDDIQEEMSESACT